MMANQRLEQAIRESLSMVIPLEHLEDATEAAYQAVQQFFLTEVLRRADERNKDG